MPEEIKKYDKNGKLIYLKTNRQEQWNGYDSRNNLIYQQIITKYPDYFKSLPSIYRIHWKYNKNNRVIYYKDYDGNECWFKYENNGQIKITKKEFEQINYLYRKKVPRYKILDI